MQAETFVSVRECWEMYGTDDSIVTINKSIDELRSTGLNGCWNKLWPQPAGKNMEHPLVGPFFTGKAFPNLEANKIWKFSTLMLQI
jgi:hypothetical protein